MKKKIIDYFVIVLGTFILAIGINFFLVPAKISTGGVSGVATMLYHLFHIPVWVTTLVFNLILLASGFKMVKKSTIVKNLTGIILLAVFLRLTENLVSYHEDVLICAVFGGILAGLGVGLTILREGSTGGSDFTALMLNKAIRHISVATFILMIDTGVILASGFVFKDVTIMFYSVLSLYISSKVTDFILIRGDFAKSIYIISKKNREIAEYIMSDIVRGVTGIYSRGCYSGHDHMMLMCIVKSKEAQQILNKVKAIDNEAFVIISEVREVCGDGFKQI
ncbi:MAG: YitT family protein [Clostridia bacterium]|nr:YitT family protein [Clostridia bacterium]